MRVAPRQHAPLGAGLACLGGPAGLQAPPTPAAPLRGGPNCFWRSLWPSPSWWFWLFIHIFFLIGFRNRVIVLVNWAWAYWSYQRHARIILGREDDAG